MLNFGAGVATEIMSSTYVCASDHKLRRQLCVSAITAQVAVLAHPGNRGVPTDQTSGETHPYIPADAAYGDITPANLFSIWSGGRGAWEIAGRVSTMTSERSTEDRRGRWTADDLQCGFELVRQ